MRSSAMKNSSEIGQYSEEVFRREFEKAMKDGHAYGVPLKKGKRFRSAFTTEQVNYLEKEFRKYPYIGNARRKDVSNVLNIPERAVKIWFQNRRMKEKKESTKESDDKPMDTIIASNCEVNVEIQTTKGVSLPTINVPDSALITAQDSGVISFNSEVSNFKDIPTANTVNSKPIVPETTDVPKMNISTFSPAHANTTVIKNNPATTAKKQMVDIYQKYKIEAISDEEDRPEDVPTTSTITKQHLAYKPEQFNYGAFVSPSVSPQDLSAKARVHKQKTISQQPSYQTNPEVKPSELPLYLKGFYAQPYIPPGNMIWKPINVAPIMTPGPMPMAVPAVTGQQNMKRSCNCDCHSKPAPVPAPVYYQHNNHNPNLQYVITAVPFQNPSPKF